MLTPVLFLGRVKITRCRTHRSDPTSRISFSNSTGCLSVREVIQHSLDFNLGPELRRLSGVRGCAGVGVLQRQFTVHRDKRDRGDLTIAKYRSFDSLRFSHPSDEDLSITPTSKDRSSDPVYRSFHFGRFKMTRL